MSPSFDPIMSHAICCQPTFTSNFFWQLAGGARWQLFVCQLIAPIRWSSNHVTEQWYCTNRSRISLDKKKIKRKKAMVPYAKKGIEENPRLYSVIKFYTTSQPISFVPSRVSSKQIFGPRKNIFGLGSPKLWVVKWWICALNRLSCYVRRWLRVEQANECTEFGPA